MRAARRESWLLDTKAALAIPVSVYLALDPLLTLDGSLVGFLRDARFLGAAAPHPLAEPFDRADVHPLLAKVLPRHVDLGLLAGAAERDVGVAASSMTTTVLGRKVMWPFLDAVGQAVDGEGAIGDRRLILAPWETASAGGAQSATMVARPRRLGRAVSASASASGA